MTKNKHHKKVHNRQLCIAVFKKERSDAQTERLKRYFKSKYGISPKKVQVNIKESKFRFGFEHMAYVIAPTVAQLERGRKTHVNPKDFLCPSATSTSPSDSKGGRTRP